MSCRDVFFSANLDRLANQNEFVKSLTANLRNLRKLEAEHRLKFYGYEDVVEHYSDNENDDDDYMARRTKKRKTAYLSL